MHKDWLFGVILQTHLFPDANINFHGTLTDDECHGEWKLYNSPDIVPSCRQYQGIL